MDVMYQMIAQLTPIRITVSRTVVRSHSMIWNIASKIKGKSNTLEAFSGSARSPVVAHGFRRSTSEYRLITVTEPIN